MATLREATSLSADRAQNLLLLAGLATAAVVGAVAATGRGDIALVLALAVPTVVVVLRYPWSAVLIWLAAMPFFIIGDGSAGPDTWLLHRLLIPGALLVSLVYRMLGLSRSHFRLSVVDLAIAAFLLLAIANIQLLSPNPVRMSAAFYDRMIIPVCMYWLIRLTEPREPELRRLMLVAIWLIVIQAGVAVLSWLAPGVLPGAWLGRAGERAIGTVGGPGPYTVTLVVAAMLLIPRLVRERENTITRLVLLVAVAGAFMGVLISFSRGSWLGAVLVLAGITLMYRRIALQVFGAVVLLAVILGAGPMSEQVSFAIERLGVQETAESRLITNNAALRMIEERPAFGFGYGNFERYDESFKVRLGDIPVQPGSAHHTYLALAAENGLPALLLYLFPALWLLMLTLVRWKRLSSGPIDRSLLVLLWLAIVHQFVVMNFMDMLHSSPWGTTLWWATLGLIHVLITRGSREPEIRRIGLTTVSQNAP
jgi:putative inorganic carbon (hco3(-)) transporter